MQHAEIRGRMSEGLDRVLSGKAKLPKPLRSYQMDGFRKERAWLQDTSAPNRGYFSYPTGLGKTMMYVVMAGVTTGLRTLIVVPTRVLVEQTCRKVTEITGGIVGQLSTMATVKDRSGRIVAVQGFAQSDILVTTDRSLQSRVDHIIGGFDPHMIVRDECHWSYSSSALDVLNRFPESVITGFSATPNYLCASPMPGYVPVELDNGLKLYGNPRRFAAEHFGTCIDERSLAWGIGNGWLAPLATAKLDLETSLDSVPLVEGVGGWDYQEAELNRTIAKEWPRVCEVVQRAYKTDQFGLNHRSAFAVCPGIVAAETLAAAVRAIGISSACITGKTTVIERNRILSAFDRGEIKFLSSVTVLREGWDAPIADVAFELRPTQSYLFYVQSMGRVLRPSADGRKIALVVDAYYRDTRLSPLSAPLLFGPPDAKYNDGDLVLGPQTALPEVEQTRSGSEIVVTTQSKTKDEQPKAEPEIKPDTTYIQAFEALVLRAKVVGGERIVRGAVPIIQLSSKIGPQDAIALLGRLEKDGHLARMDEWRTVVLRSERVGGIEAISSVA